jgi:hypothetical protein
VVDPTVQSHYPIRRRRLAFPDSWAGCCTSGSGGSLWRCCPGACWSSGRAPTTATQPTQRVRSQAASPPVHPSPGASSPAAPSSTAASWLVATARSQGKRGSRLSRPAAPVSPGDDLSARRMKLIANLGDRFSASTSKDRTCHRDLPWWRTASLRERQLTPWGASLVWPGDALTPSHDGWVLPGRLARAGRRAPHGRGAIRGSRHSLPSPLTSGEAAPTFSRHRDYRGPSEPWRPPAVSPRPTSRARRARRAVPRFLT